jgi:hypothetical protein
VRDQLVRRAGEPLAAEHALDVSQGDREQETEDAQHDQELGECETSITTSVHFISPFASCASCEVHAMEKRIHAMQKTWRDWRRMEIPRQLRSRRAGQEEASISRASGMITLR